MLKGLESTWKAAALLTFNTLVLILIANCLSWLVLALRPPSTGPKLEPEALLEAYPGVSESQIRQIQSETWGRDYAYEPFTQFKEGPVQGDFVNVDETGFRKSPSGAPWPARSAAINVFVFGGSTTFGYGLDDGSTIPAALERHLLASGCADLVVYNLARSNYFSTQERILFEQLLLDGHVPSAAVFIDGLNEFIHADGEPKFTNRLTYFMAESRLQLLLRALKQTALGRLVRSLASQKDVSSSGPQPDQDQAARLVLDRWESNRELIQAVADTRGIATLFVWQPVPFFPHDAEVNPFLRDSAVPIPNADLLSVGYELMAGRTRTDTTLWLADLDQPSPKEPSYVDRVHYSAAFSSVIAGRIADDLAPALCSLAQSP